jgi:hypothetical protein
MPSASSQGKFGESPFLNGHRFAPAVTGNPDRLVLGLMRERVEIALEFNRGGLGRGCLGVWTTDQLHHVNF